MATGSGTDQHLYRSIDFNRASPPLFKDATTWRGASKRGVNTNGGSGCAAEPVATANADQIESAHTDNWKDLNEQRIGRDLFTFLNKSPD